MTDKPLKQYDLGWLDGFNAGIKHENKWRTEADKTIAYLARTIDNLQGFIRRLERSNQALAEENNHLRGNGIGWNKLG